MSKILILDWQKNSLILAKCHGRGSKAVIDEVSLQNVGGVDVDSRTATEALRLATQELSAKGDVLVLVSRELVEMRTVQIPQVEADDLPDVIRFQAQRQLASMGDSWPLDFVMLPPSEGSELQTALVAAIPPTHLQEIESACAAAGLQPSKIILRPISVAHMAIEGGFVPNSGRSAIVGISESVVDILILRQGKVVQVRTTKLPTEADQIPQTLSGELRRSLFAANQELDGKAIDSALLIAVADRLADLAPVVQKALSVSTVNLQPESLMSNPDRRVADIAAARLVAVAGASAISASDSAAIIDFKNPKRRPPKQRDSRKWLLLVGSVAALLLLAVSWYYSKRNSLKNDLELLQEQIAARKETAESDERRLAEYAAIESFAASSPNWLEEIVYISQRIPGSEKVMLDNPTFSINTSNGTGEVTFALKSVDNSKSVTELANSLRDENHHKISTPTMKPLPSPEGKYGYFADAKMTILGQGWDLNAPKHEVEGLAPTTETKGAPPADENRSSAKATGAGNEPRRPGRRPPSTRSGDVAPKKDGPQTETTPTDSPSSESTSESAPSDGSSSQGTSEADAKPPAENSATTEKPPVAEPSSQDESKQPASK